MALDKVMLVASLVAVFVVVFSGDVGVSVSGRRRRKLKERKINRSNIINEGRRLYLQSGWSKLGYHT